MRRWRFYLATLLLLVTLIYAWQIAGLWADEQNRDDQYEVYLGAHSLISGRPTLAIELSGKGIAAGATASLHFSGRDTNGVLRIQDMPVLPDSKLYQLWCIDRSNDMDRCISFKVPVAGSQEPMVMGILAPRMLDGYAHFMITVEAANDSPETPSDLVVMSN